MKSRYGHATAHQTIRAPQPQLRKANTHLLFFIPSHILCLVKMRFSFNTVVLALLAVASTAIAAPYYPSKLVEDPKPVPREAAPYYPSKLSEEPKPVPREAAPYYPSKLVEDPKPVPREAAPYYPSKLTSEPKPLPREALPYYPSKLSAEPVPIPRDV